MRVSSGLLQVCIFVSLAGGCVSARTTLLSSETYPAVPEEDVRVFLARDLMPASCERIAMIRMSADSDLTTENQMIRRARQRAGQIGANAILIDYIRNPSTGTQIAAVLFGTPDDRKGRVAAFHCSGEQAAGQPARSGHEVGESRGAGAAKSLPMREPLPWTGLEGRDPGGYEFREGSKR
jgi:hypothetical protein